MILSKVKTDKIDLDFLIAERIKDRSLNSVLFIVPTNRKIRYLKRELISVSPNNSASNLNLETIGSYSVKLLSNTTSKKIISDESSIVLLNQSFSEVKLKYFSRYKEAIPFGTLERIKNVIDEYKRHGISSADLMQEAQKLSGTEKIKAEDIAAVYQDYQQKLNDLNEKETGDVYSELLKLSDDDFNNFFKEIYPETDLIIINGFDEFSQPEIDIINRTAELAGKSLYLKLDYYKYNPLIFSHLDNCHKKFTEKGFKEIPDVSPSANVKFINDVREKYFKETGKNKSKYFKDKLTVITANSREEETELIAKEIKELIINKNVNPSDICVVFNLIKNYSPLIRDRFKQYGIPFNLTDRFSLNTSSPVIAILNFLEILEKDFYYKTIFRALSSYFIKINGIDLANLLKTSVELKIVSGYSNWLNRLQDAGSEIQFTEEDTLENQKKLEAYKLAEDNIKEIFNRLKPFKDELLPSEFFNLISGLIFKLNIPLKILNANDFLVEKETRAITTFINSLKEITDLIEKEFGSEKKFPLKYFLKQLKTSSAFTRYNLQEKFGYGVQVTNLNEIRGLKFDYLFIGGMNDGDLPTRYLPEIFLSGSFAKEEKKHQVEERYHFYQALCVWNKKLYLSYPLNDGKRELVKSNFLNDFIILFNVTGKTAEDYSNTIYSKDELLKFIGELQAENLSEELISAASDVDINSLKNNIAINKKRMSDPFGKSSFTGFISDDLSADEKEKLKNIKEEQFSVTQLETFAKCPYKYFAERILHLKTIEEPTEELEALEFGSLLHVILYEFYTSLQKKGIILQQCTKKEFGEAKKLIFKIAEEKFDKLKLGSEQAFFEKEKLLGVKKNRSDSLLYKFLEYERAEEKDFVPSYFEFEFGKTDNHPDLMEDFKAGDVKVRGKIDRIELNEEENLIKVVDYKLSGSKPSANDLLGGISLQLPLYLHAAKELISAQLEKDFKPAGAEIYSFKYARKDFGKNKISIKKGRAKDKKLAEEINTAEEMIKICNEAISKYVNEISLGNFHLSTLQDRENKVCKYCSFKLICRIQDVN